jgi:hypothetical protein
MWDLIKENFDKFLVSFFVLYFTFLGWHSLFYLAHHDGTIVANPVVQSFMAAMLDNQKLVIGALLGLITGKAIGSTKNGGSNVPPTNSSNTSTTSSTT